jgi:hypothetical protein
MKGILGFVVALVALGATSIPAQAHPLLIEESEVIPNPDPTLTACCREVAIDGDDAIMLGRRDQPDPDPEGYDDTYVRAMHCHRGVPAWTYVGQLDETLLGNEADAPNQFAVAMRDGVAAVAMLSLRVFERAGSVYTAVPDDHSLGAPGQYLYIDGGNILFGDGAWGGSIVRKGPDGAWHSVAFIYAGYSGDGDGANGGPVAISGASAAVFDPYNIDELPPGIVMFRNFGGADWRQTQRITAQPGHSLGLMAISGGVMYVNDDPRHGTPRYYRSTADNLWRPSGLVLRADGDHRLINNYQGGFDDILVGDNFVLRQAWDADKQASVVQVFQYVAPSVLGQVATLAASDGASLNGHMAMSGRRVVVGATQKAYVFDVPQQPRAPALIQHTFEDSGAAAWSIASGEFVVAQGDTSHVFRTNTAGAATAVLDAANWTQQSIQADVKPTAISGSDRWVGLATRYSDAANYYYVTLRSSGVVQLKRMLHGSFSTLDSANLPFALNRNYRLRLESVGPRQRVYVDGVRVLDVMDRELAQGRPALLTNRAAADFDNVVVSPADLATIWWRTGSRVCDLFCPAVEWQTADGDWSWQTEGTNEYFTQSSLTGAGRAPAGAVTRNVDQVVESRVRLRAWGSASDPWIGLLARYQDLDNYVYLSWRRSNTLTLRKLVNGQIQELGVVSQPLPAGTWHHVKLDAVGKWLRAYVDGRLVLEVVDPQPTPGQVGVVTNRAQADFDDFLAARP